MGAVGQSAAQWGNSMAQHCRLGSSLAGCYRIRASVAQLMRAQGQAAMSSGGTRAHLGVQQAWVPQAPKRSGVRCFHLGGQDAAGLWGSVLPALGKGCCRTSVQRDRLLHAPGPMRPAQPKGQSFAAPGEGKYLRYTAGRPGRAPECPEQDGEAAASGPPLLPSLS